MISPTGLSAGIAQIMAQVIYSQPIVNARLDKALKLSDDIIDVVTL